MLSSYEIEWMFFDVGTTLLDETPAHEKRSKDLLQYIAPYVELTVDELTHKQERLALSGVSSPFRALVDDLQIPERVRLQIAKEVRFDRSLEVPYEGAISAVEWAGDRFRVGIVANQSPGLAERLSQKGFLARFEVCVVSDEVGLCKPDPRIFRMALDLAECSADESVMVGDRLDNDIRPANELGMKTLWVRQGWRNAAEMPAVQPVWDAEILHISELPRLFR